MPTAAGRYHLPTISRRSSWPPPKPEPAKPLCYGDQRRIALMRDQILPEVANGAYIDTMVVEKWVDRKKRLARERAGLVDPPKSKAPSKRRPISEATRRRLKRQAARRQRQRI